MFPALFAVIVSMTGVRMGVIVRFAHA
jgi:hypothetical protein